MEPRKQRVLQAVTDDYISTAEPVGSRTIARKYNLGVSPATIRNEMSDLEDAGYLQQPHTSAGRVPSDRGYRFYVDVLVEPRDVLGEERELLRREMHRRRHAFESLIHGATRLLAALTPYTSVTIAPIGEDSVVRRIHLMGVDEVSVLVILITDPNLVRHRIAEASRPLSAERLSQLTEELNDLLAGVRLVDLGSGLLAEMRELMVDPGLYEDVTDLLTWGLQSDELAFYLDGARNLLAQPEFQDVDRVRALLTLLEERDALLPSLASGEGEGVMVAIGRENLHEEMWGCSLVTTTYLFGDHPMGRIGVLGPTRMDYARVLGMVDAVGEALTESLADAIRDRP